MNKITPMLSIISVVRNDVSGISRTSKSVASLLECFPGKIEWIVIDGGSTDGTVEWLINCSFVEKFVSEPDDGIYDAMWKGILQARGDYVWMVNAGDEIIIPSICLELIHKMVEARADVAYCGVVYCGENEKWNKYPRCGFGGIWHSVPGNQQGTFYKKSALNSEMFLSAPKICGDYYISAILYKNSAKQLYFNELISLFYLGGVSSKNYIKLCVEAWGVQREVLRIGIFLRLISFMRRLAARFYQYIFIER